MSPTFQVYRDSNFVEDLVKLESEKGSDYWSFRNGGKRQGAHALISYPAMMVPTLQGTLMDLVERRQKLRTVMDPFVGSGTVMTETMHRGLDFLGIDINPLAGLACKVKSGPYFVDALEEKYAALLARLTSSKRSPKSRTFPGVNKWFHAETASGLEKIAVNLRKEESLWARRIFWLALGRTVRQVSNSRLTTYKLHIRKGESEAKNSLLVFKSQCRQLIDSLIAEKQTFSARGVFRRGWYTGKVETLIGDSRNLLGSNENKYDLIMTSPPYGDNATTIPYGQYSYLPLMWIDVEDICPGIESQLLENTRAIDSNSLGGSLKNYREKLDFLCDNYLAAREFANDLGSDQFGLKRFCSFFSDLDQVVERIGTSTTPGGYHSWTVGNRRISGKSVPMLELLVEMLSKRGVNPIVAISREIPQKKMAPRNSIAMTMAQESILIAQLDR